MRVFLLAGLVALSVVTASAAAPKCGFHDIKRTLADQGFTGALGDGGDTLKRLGSWGIARSTYAVLWYEHVDRTRPAGHAVRSIVVMDRNCRYLGRYAVNATQPYVRGRVIYFADVPASEGNKIVLKANGHPPEKVWIDGENPELAK